jgi:bacterioferritin-associated ferredoxin
VLVCHCHRVNDAVVEQVLAAGADSVRGVVRATRAGTDCGGCLPMLREICRRTAAAAVAACPSHENAALAG